MTPSRLTLLLRQAIPALLALALLVLAVLSTWRAFGLRAQLHDESAKELEDQLTDSVERWEDTMLAQLGGWLEDAGNSPDPATLQDQLRAREAWFDSLYTWDPPREITIGGRRRITRGDLSFPIAQVREDTLWVRSHPCMRNARLLSLSLLVDPAVVADAYLAGCKGEPINVRLASAGEAAGLLLKKQRPDEALHALDHAGLDPAISLPDAMRAGVPAFRLVSHRLQRADVLLSTGLVDDALDLYYQTGIEITELDAPDAEPLLGRVQDPIMSALASKNRDLEVERLRIVVQRAERRVRAWVEVRDRILPSVSPMATEAPRLIYDQLERTPYLLFYGTSSKGRVSAALELDQPLLVGDLLSSLKRFQKDLVITNAQGAWVAGARPRESEVAVQVPFMRTLTHLRVGLYDEAVEERYAKLDDQWITPLVVTFICVVLGLFALSAQVRANRRLQDLLVRQREFTTRVTHELKTPLAGIQVMAENLELGAWRDDAHREEMARRIFQEAQRLGQRVDDVLAVVRERSIPSPVPFEPEEPVMEAVEHWAPRLDDAGVLLHVDLDNAPQVSGDPAAVRDAVGCLLDNALKYRREGAPEQSVWLNLKSDGRDAVIEVIDNGIGVPPGMRKRIFDRFVRVEGPNRGMAGGHGLGLAQVAEVARLHRGRVDCSEGIDGGSRFVLRLRGGT